MCYFFLAMGVRHITYPLKALIPPFIKRERYCKYKQDGGLGRMSSGGKNTAAWRDHTFQLSLKEAAGSGLEKRKRKDKPG